MGLTFANRVVRTGTSCEPIGHAVLITATMAALAIGAVVPASAGPDATDAVPEGLSPDDWTQISAQLETERYRTRWVHETPIEGVNAAVYANNREQQLHSYFSADGVNVLPHDTAAGWRLEMRLSGWGWDGDMAQVEGIAPVAEGNRVEYRRGALTEWFVNNRSGLEQGFTIASPPRAGEPSTLHLEMKVSDELRPSLTQDGRAIQFTDDRAEAVLRYSGLRAWDANGRDLKSAFSVGERAVRIIVQTSDAAYPITVDPTLTQVALLLPTVDPFVQAEAHFGSSVAVDGDTAVVGAPEGDTLYHSGSGAAYVYVRSGATWAQQALLDPFSVPAVQLGASVAIEGDRAVIGAPLTEGGEGRVFVFARTGTTWAEEAVIAAADAAADDEFGSSVSLDGDTIVVGSPLDDDTAGADAGSAYVFTWSGSSWDQQIKLVADDAAADDRFGGSVAISGDTAIVGAHFHDHFFGGAGSAYVFVRSGTSWTQQAELLASDAAFSDYFGRSVSLDGDTAVIGAEWDDNVFSNAGSAYVFVRSGTAWSEQAKLVASDAYLNDRFGISVSVEGDTAVVGSHYSNHSGISDSGAAFVFVRSGTVWSEQTKLVGSSIVSGDRMGISVALGGETVFAGASRDDHDSATDAGSAFAFTRNGTVWTEQQNLIATDGAEWDSFGMSVAISGDTAVVGAPYDNQTNSLSAGSVRIFVRSGDDWNEEARLVGSDTKAGDNFGFSVAIDGDTVAVGAIHHDHSSQQDAGAVYIFVRTGTLWNEQQKLVDVTPFHGDYLGNSIAIDGDTVIAGEVGTNAGVLDGGSAVVFVRSGTVWSEQQELIASDASNSARFGQSVAIDGDIAVIGAMQDDLGAITDCGSAYVFVRSGTTWSEQTKLFAVSAAEDDGFGASVAIDGDIAVVGALFRDLDGVTDVGTAYIFEYSGTVWLLRKVLAASDPVQDGHFGLSVSVADDAVAVGMPASITHPGAAYVFMRSGAAWLQVPSLVVANPMDGDELGRSVAIQRGWLLAGAPADDDVGFHAGSVAVFRWYFADLAITKDDGQIAAIPGDVVSYSVVATNSVGPDDVADARVYDTFPPELVACAWSCSPANGASCVPNGIGNISESVDLPIGGAVTFTANCIVAPGATGTVANLASVYAPTVDDPFSFNDVASDTDTLTPQADLWITETDGQTTAFAGGQVVYTITAANEGLSDAMSAMVTDTFPDELSCTWSCVGSGATCTATGTGAISDTVNLAVGTSVVYTATCAVSPCATGSLVNTATINSPPGVPDPLPTNNSATDIDQILQSPDLVFADCFESGDTTAWSNVTP